jgi:hypothetical protein
MRWLILRILSVYVMLAALCCIAIVMGRLQPIPRRLAILHLNDCQLPCWMGIIPGQTRFNEAKERVMQGFKNALATDGQHDRAMWSSINDPDAVQIYIYAMRPQPDDHDPVIQHISVMLWDTGGDNIKVGDLINVIGYPTSTASVDHRGVQNSYLVFENMSFHLTVSTNEIVSCNPITKVSEIRTIGVNSAGIPERFRQPWHGFRSCYPLLKGSSG